MRQSIFRLVVFHVATSKATPPLSNFRSEMIYRQDCSNHHHQIPDNTSRKNSISEACSVITTGIGYTDGDIGTCVSEASSMTTSEHCCACCNATEGCSGFTLYGDVCYLKDRTALPTACDKCTSGTVSRAVVPQPCKIYPGKDLSPGKFQKIYGMG